MDQFKFTRTAGFTILELIITIVLISLVAVFVTTRNIGDLPSLDGATNQVASDIRLTRALSMNRDARFRINFFSTYYTITDITGVTPYNHPTSGTANITLGTGITMTSTQPFLVFDGLGAPYNSSSLAASPLSTDTTITLTATDGSTKSIVVVAETGKVTLQ